MDYKGCYGKTVNVLVEKDNWGETLNTQATYVITRLEDRDTESIGLYRLREGDTVAEILSTQPKSYEVYAKDVVEMSPHF